MEESIQQEMQPTNRKPFPKIFFIIVGLVALIGTGIVTTFSLNKQKATTPEENMFYLATKENSPILFYRYPDLMIEHKKAERTVGHLAYYEKPFDLKKDPNEYANFKDLQNPKKLFDFEGHPMIENYILSEDKHYLLLSFLGGKSDSTNYIYQINLRTREPKKIWEHELRSGKPPFNEGFAYVTHLIPNKYIVFAIVKDTPPPAAQPIGVVIKNIQSGQEKILGVVGDIQINESTKTVSFKRVVQTQAPCEENDAVCFATDSYKFVYLPEGETFTEPLP